MTTRNKAFYVLALLAMQPIANAGDVYSPTRLPNDPHIVTSDSHTSFGVNRASSGEFGCNRQDSLLINAECGAAAAKSAPNGAGMNSTESAPEPAMLGFFGAGLLSTWFMAAWHRRRGEKI